MYRLCIVEFWQQVPGNVCMNLSIYSYIQIILLL